MCSIDGVLICQQNGCRNEVTECPKALTDQEPKSFQVSSKFRILIIFLLLLGTVGQPYHGPYRDITDFYPALVLLAKTLD